MLQDGQHSGGEVPADVSPEETVRILKVAASRGKLGLACKHLQLLVELGRPFGHPRALAGRRLAMATLRAAVAQVPGASLQEGCTNKAFGLTPDSGGDGQGTT